MASGLEVLVGRRVRERRQERGRSQDELAAAADLHRNYVAASNAASAISASKRTGRPCDSAGVSLAQFLFRSKQASALTARRFTILAGALLMTNRRLLGAIAMVLAIAGGRAASAARQTSSRITPEEIQEALELSADEGAMRRFALRHTLQTRSGIGEGPLLGYVSTPFSRVVLAGAAARKAGTPLTVADVPQDLLSPEFHLVVLPQTAAYSAGESSLLEVVILLRSKPGNAGAPLRTESPNAAQARLYGLARTEGVTVHVFPMTASADFGTVRVSFSQVLRGSTALTNCATCIIPLPRDLR